MKAELKAVSARQCERRELERMRDAAEFLWIVLANVSEGDWTKQNEEWQTAAARARDDYHTLCKQLNLRTA